MGKNSRKIVFDKISTWIYEQNDAELDTNKEKRIKTDDFFFKCHHHRGQLIS